MFNAQIDANLDMKQFDANQQMALANSSFMQTMTIKNFDARQQEAYAKCYSFSIYGFSSC